ncbi:MAG TPA: phosphoglycerate kinase [Acidimicrobiia bacterium]
MDQLDFAGKRVLVRADLNVPMELGRVSDDFRIRKALPAIELLSAGGAESVLVCSHLGRPKDREPELGLAPVSVRMAELLAGEVVQLPGVVGDEVEAAARDLAPGAIALLENTRFESGETKNDPLLADALARLADVFVEDAFGSVHRAHASTVGVAERLRSAAGPLLISEIEGLGRFLGDPDRPYVVVLGGAKVSDKLGVIKHLLPKVDSMLIGGAMCFTLLAAAGAEVGDSRLEPEMIDEVGKLLTGPDGDKLVLPSDIVAASAFEESAEAVVTAANSIPRGRIGLDIGPGTSARFAGVIKDAASLFWNGPMGVFEWERFRHGTEAVAEAVAGCAGWTAVGGGDSVAALRILGLEDSVSHLSTGGGAGLELLEGRDLPGVAVLERWVDGP